MSRIEELIEKGYAYESEGDVYYRARKFDGYGKVKSQSVKPGTDLRKGGVINLALNGK